MTTFSPITMDTNNVNDSALGTALLRQEGGGGGVPYVVEWEDTDEDVFVG